MARRRPGRLRHAVRGRGWNGVGSQFYFEHRHERDNPELRYPDLLARVHRSIAESFGIETSDALDEAFGASVPLWPAFPDTADALRTLKRHYKLVILPNVHRDGFAARTVTMSVSRCRW